MVLPLLFPYSVPHSFTFLLLFYHFLLLCRHSLYLSLILLSPTPSINQSSLFFFLSRLLLPESQTHSSLGLPLSHPTHTLSLCNFRSNLIDTLPFLSLSLSLGFDLLLVVVVFDEISD